MTTVSANHVSWNKIWVVVAAVLIPALGVGTLVIRGGQNLIDRMDNMTVKVSDISGDLKQVKDDLKQLHIQVDTISHRQEINNITNNYRFQLQQSQSHVWKPKPGYITQVR